LLADLNLNVLKTPWVLAKYVLKADKALLSLLSQSAARREKK
jgi:hypothetical protein